LSGLEVVKIGFSSWFFIMLLLVGFKIDSFLPNLIPLFSRVALSSHPRNGSVPRVQAVMSPPRSDEARLWLIAGLLSLLLNVLILALVGIAAIERSKRTPRETAQKPESVVTIMPEIARTNPKPAEPSPESAAKKTFARTSADQVAEKPTNASRIGERNTQATSDRTPTEGAPLLPSQAGIKPRFDDDVETTESQYRDGPLKDESTLAPSPAMPEAAAPVPPVPQTPEQAAAASAPKRDSLVQGPKPMDVPVPRKSGEADALKSPLPAPPAEMAQPAKPVSQSPPKPASTAKRPEKPAFKGYQRKAAIVGSISRTGRSALDVEDSRLGRYQAVIGRAVEQEWQRNCVRHRDFITPGFLTVRFFVEPNGRVKSVQFVGDMETGEIQKGFTLNSIRDAEIPPMPATLKPDFKDAPLELIFRFYF